MPVIDPNEVAPQPVIAPTPNPEPPAAPDLENIQPLEGDGGTPATAPTPEDLVLEAAPQTEPELAPEPDPFIKEQIAPDDNMEREFKASQEDGEGQAAVAEMEALLGEDPEASTPTAALIADAEKQTPPSADGEGVAGAIRTTARVGTSIALDVSRGLMESPREMSRGVVDAAQSSLDLVADLSEQVRKIAPAEATQSMESFEKWLKKPMVKTEDSKSVTGGLIRGVTQFMAGYFAGGALLRGFKVASTTGRVLKGIAQGAISDFTVFEGADAKLGDLLAKNKVLAKVVPDFMRSQADDSAIEGRLKHVLEGAGLGAATEGFVLSLKALKKYRAVEATESYIKKLQGEEVPMKDIAPEDLSLLGDLNNPNRYVDKFDAAATQSQGVTADDLLKGNTPTKKEINFLNVNSTEDVKSLMQEHANRFQDTSVRTHADVQASAEQLDAFKVLMERRPGQPLSDVQITATRDLWVTSGNKLMEVAQLASREPSPANLFMMRKMLTVHGAIEKEVLGAGTEIGRALNAMKIVAKERKEMAMQIDELLKVNGGEKIAKQFADSIAAFGSAGMQRAISKMSQGSIFTRTNDAFFQLYINSLLSNPMTHVVNAMSNSSVAFQQIYERKTAEYLTQAFGTENGVALGEAAAMLYGMRQGSREALELMATKYKMADSLPDAMKQVVDYTPSPGATPKWGETSQGGAWTSERWGIAKNTTTGQFLDTIDHGMSLPGRMLGATDDIFKTIGYRMELHAQAVRQASAEAKGTRMTPDVFKKRVAEIIENPSQDVRIASVNQAMYQTFQNAPAALPKAILDGFQKIPVFGRLVVPFKNIPINIGTYGFERTPFAPLVAKWRADVAAGGARRDTALARMATGTTIMAVASDQAMNGGMTGRAPSHPGERLQWQRAGKQPYSIQVGDKWLSYSRLDPIGFTLGFAADLAAATLNAQGDVQNQHFEKAIAGFMFAGFDNMMSKQYLRGISETITAISDYTMHGQNYIRRQSGSVVPAGVASLRRNGLPFLADGLNIPADEHTNLFMSALQGDPYKRQANDLLDALMDRVPGFSKNVPVYYDLWGRTVDMRSGFGWGYDVFMPVYVKTESPEPVDKELQRLSFYPDDSDATMSFNGVLLELSAKQEMRFKQLAGNELPHPSTGLGMKDFLNAVIERRHDLSEQYYAFQDDRAGAQSGKAQFIQHWINSYRDLAKKRLLEEDGALKGLYNTKDMATPNRFDSGTKGDLWQ